MQLAVIRIGNSKGIRLSKTMIEKYGIQDFVDITLSDEGILIKPVVNPRQGWENAFIDMHKSGDDQLLIDDVFEDENLDQ